MDPMVIGTSQGEANRRDEHIIEGLKKPIKHFQLVADGVKTARRLDVMVGGTDAALEDMAALTPEGHIEVIEVPWDRP